MRSQTLRWLSLSALLFCAFATAQDSATAAIEECIAKIGPAKPGVPQGFGEIQQACPELRAVMERSSIASWLPEGWWGPRLSTANLRALRDHAAFQSDARQPRTLDTSGLAAALASLDDEARSSPVSWRDRLREWLRKRLQGDSQEPEPWLFEWVDVLARYETAVRIAGYCLFGLIILSAVLIMLNELRAAGVLGSAWQRQSRPAGALASTEPTHALTLSDVDRSDPLNRPSMLLTLLLAALGRREDRAIAASVTHRELAHRVDLGDESRRLAFARLLRCAERVRYAATLPTSTEIDAAVIGGRRLLETLRNVPT